jgi:hypothetical protein
VRPLLLVGLAILLGSPLEAQSLGDAARREREKRQSQPKRPVKTYSDADLPESPPDSAGVKAQASAAEAAPPSSPGSPPEESIGLPDDPEARKQLEKVWRARFDEARANLRAADARAWQRKLDVVWVAGIPYQTWVQEHVETEELKQARRDLADLEEEFRRTGFPPGWSRE